MKNVSAVALGKLGGAARSEAKTKAARENAKKGGWPKGKKRKPVITPVSGPCPRCGTTLEQPPRRRFGQREITRLKGAQETP